jgi:hypothetical protein
MRAFLFEVPDVSAGHVVDPIRQAILGASAIRSADRGIAQLAVQIMKLHPCPFCEGPPCPITVRVLKGGGCFPDSELAGDDGLFVKSYVFCHECGSHGPAISDICFDRADCADLERQAVALWQDRSAKNRSLYDGGEPEGLNEYPRADES